jgi:hypothetical protein
LRVPRGVARHEAWNIRQWRGQHIDRPTKTLIDQRLGRDAVIF